MSTYGIHMHVLGLYPEYYWDSKNKDQEKVDFKRGCIHGRHFYPEVIEINSCWPQKSDVAFTCLGDDFLGAGRHQKMSYK